MFLLLRHCALLVRGVLAWLGEAWLGEAPRSVSEGGVGWGKGPYSTVLARWSGGTLEVPVCMHWHGIR